MLIKWLRLFTKQLCKGEIKMIVLELFAGTRSIGKAFEAAGHKVVSIDWDKQFKDIDLYADIGELTAQ
jgi:adenine-specific DNA methylase